jgi:ABC-type polysaccharide/polyol phosphate export permease
VLGVLVYFGYWKTANYPVAALGLLFLVANVAWISLLVAIISARFRDIPQIVQSITQAAAIMTPVFWLPDRIPEKYHLILDLNPFYHLLEAVRAPLLGKGVAPHTYLFLAGMAEVGWLLTFSLFANTRRRIVHYL